MNIARLFSYTREIERQRDQLQAELQAECERLQELTDMQIFNRLPARLYGEAPSVRDVDRVSETPVRPDGMDDGEWQEWVEKYNQADPLTRADMDAEIEGGTRAEG